MCVKKIPSQKGESPYNSSGNLRKPTPEYEYALQRCSSAREFSEYTTPAWFPASHEPEEELSEETVACIKRGIHDIRSGKTIPAEKVWEKLGL